MRIKEYHIQDAWHNSWPVKYSINGNIYHCEYYYIPKVIIGIQDIVNASRIDGSGVKFSIGYDVLYYYNNNLLFVLICEQSKAILFYLCLIFHNSKIGMPKNL